MMNHLQEEFSFFSSFIPSAFERYLLGVGAVIGSFSSFFFGDKVKEFLLWLFIFVFVDFVLGTIASVKNGEWDSGKCYAGVIKKFIIFLLVALTHGLDVFLSDVVQTNLIQYSLIGAFLVWEFGSIIENIVLCGWGSIIPKCVLIGVKSAKESMNKKAEDIGDKFD